MNMVWKSGWQSPPTAVASDGPIKWSLLIVGLAKLVLGWQWAVVSLLVIDTMISLVIEICFAKLR